MAKNLVHSQETHIIIGICMEVHRQLGRGFLEIVYKDALEYEFSERNIIFDREKEFRVRYKSIIMTHKYHADFVVYDRIILEVKAQKCISESQVKQLLNYLAVSGCKVGLIINFGESSLTWKRLVL